MLKVPRKAFMIDIRAIHRAYYDTIYSVTKAILSPVTDATADVFREAIQQAVKDGMQNTYSVNLSHIGEILLGKKK